MKYPESDVEELVQAALIWAKPGCTVEDARKLQTIAEKFRPKPPRVGTLVIKTPDPVFPNATTVINDGGIEFTDEIRQACADAGIEWEETT